MMTFWIGAAIGLFLGTGAGVFLTCLVVVARREPADAPSPEHAEIERMDESIRMARLCLMTEVGEHRCWAMDAAAAALAGETFPRLHAAEGGRY